MTFPITTSSRIVFCGGSAEPVTEFSIRQPLPAAVNPVQVGDLVDTPAAMGHRAGVAFRATGDTERSDS